MVKLSLIVEGGAFDTAAEVANNVESLRQSLYKFFNRILGRDDIDIVIFLGAGYRNAVKQFVDTNTIPLILFVDLDYPPNSKHMWFTRLTNELHPELTITIPEEKIQYIFFMVQEMEAWFLKQPDCLNRWAESEGYDRKSSELDIADHSLIRGKNIEEIAKPSEKLAILIKRFFCKGSKAIKYGKLKHAPQLLDSLNVDLILPLDSELQRFVSLIKGN